MLKERAKDKEVRPRTVFFSCPKMHVGCGAYSIMKALKAGTPRALDALHKRRICFQVSCVQELCIFSLLPSVFSSKHHLLVSHQKEGKSCCLPRSQKHYDFLTVPPYWLFTVDATCLPRTGGAALPQAVVLGLRQLTPYHPWAALQSSCLGADFQKGSSVFLFFAYDSLLLQLWSLSLILTN